MLRSDGPHRSTVRGLFEAMKAETIPIGERLIAQETALDKLFADHKVTPDTLAATHGRDRRHPGQAARRPSPISLVDGRAAAAVANKTLRRIARLCRGRSEASPPLSGSPLHDGKFFMKARKALLVVTAASATAPGRFSMMSSAGPRTALLVHLAGDVVVGTEDVEIALAMRSIIMNRPPARPSMRRRLASGRRRVMPV